MISPLRAGLIARVSNDRSGEARSVREQQDENVRACEGNGWVITERYEMTGSASRFSRADRPEWERLLRDLQDQGTPVGVIVMWEPSRASRTNTEWSRFLDLCLQRGVLVHITSHHRTYDVTVSRDWRSLADDGVDSAFESAKVSDRTKRALDASARRGRPLGITCYGYRRVFDPLTKRFVRQEIVEEEAAIVREIVRRVGSGHALCRIAADLNRRGVTPPMRQRKTSKTGAWHTQTVRRIAASPAYVSQRKWKGETLDGAWPAIVTAAEHRDARAVIDARKGSGTRPGKNKWTYTYLIRCGKCGSWIQVRDGNYRCRPRGCASMRVGDLDLLMEAYITERLGQGDVIASFLGSDDAAAEAARGEAAALRADVEANQQMYVRGEISAATLRAVELDREPRIRASERRATDLALPGVLRQFAGILGRQAAVWDAWVRLPVAAKRDVTRALAEDIVLYPRSMRPKGPAQLEVTWRETPERVAVARPDGELPAEYVAPSWAAELDEDCAVPSGGPRPA